MIPKEIVRQIRRIEIRSRFLVDSFLAGNYHSVFRGQGIEFAGLRDYTRGDDYRSLDWKVTARTGRPHVRIHDEERLLTVQVLLDLSGSTSFGTRGRRKRTLAAEFCAALAFSAVANNDQVGLILFTDRVEKSVKPGKGRTNALRVVREILYHEPAGRATDLAAPLAFLMRSSRTRTVAFLVSDFLGGASLPPILQAACARHDVIPVVLRDPLERELPDAGYVEARDLETGEVALVNTSDPAVRLRYAELSAGRDRLMRQEFAARGLDHIELSTDLPWERPLLDFFSRRERLHARARPGR